MPSSKNYVRNYDQEQKTAKKRGEYPDTLARNRNRKQAIKDGKVSRGDGKDLAHKLAKSKGGSDDKSNLKVQDDGANRSFPRTSSGAMKGKS